MNKLTMVVNLVLVILGSLISNTIALDCYECLSTESCRYAFEPNTCRYDKTVCMKSIEAQTGEVRKLCAGSCSSLWLDEQLVDPLNTKYINFCCDTDACNSAELNHTHFLCISQILFGAIAKILGNLI